MQSVEVHYIVHLQDKDFDKLLKDAEELGHDFNDAGKMLTLKRYLQDEGLNQAESILQDLNAIKVETIS